MYEGTAHFTDDHAIEVHYPDGSKSEPLTAEKIYIATGGKTKIPAMAGVENVDYNTSESFFGENIPPSRSAISSLSAAAPHWLRICAHLPLPSVRRRAAAAAQCASTAEI